MRKVAFAGEYPRCFDSLEQFDAWLEAQSLAYAKYGPCTDCLPTFQMEMKKQGRCENPDVVFMKDREGNFEGYVPVYLWKREDFYDNRLDANEQLLEQHGVRPDHAGDQERAGGEGWWKTDAV